jgi:hypothetical protein
MRASVVIAAALIAGGSACKRDQRPDENKVTPTSDYDATAPIVDEDYRFRLAWPGKGWKMLREREVRATNPDAVAGAMSDDDVWGVVVVEFAPGVELEGYAKQVLSAAVVDEVLEQRTEPIAFAGKPALVLHARVRARGIEVRYRVVMFQHQDFAYQVMAWSVGDGDAKLETFAGTFTLLDGKVTKRLPPRVLADVNGVGWRVKAGVFESVVSGLAAAPPSPWRVVVGSELAGMNTAAELGLVDGLTEAYIVVIPERAGGDPGAVAAALVEAFALGKVRKPDDALTVTVAGVPVELQTYASEEGAALPMEQLHTAVVLGDHVVQLIAWYHAGNRAAGRAAIPQGFAAIERMAAGRLATVRSAIEAAGDPETAVGRGFSLRRGVYRNFEHGLTWTKPPGFWHATTGSAAEAEGGILVLEELSLGLFAMLSITGVEGPPEAEHETNIEGARPLGPPAERIISGTRALVSDVLDGEGEAYQTRRRVATIVRGGHVLTVEVYGRPRDVAQATSAVDAVFDQLVLGPIEAVDDSGGVYRDLRLGFSIEPPADATFHDQATSAVDALIGAPTWKSRRGMVEVMVMAVLETGDDEKWWLSMFEQRFRDLDGRDAVQVRDVMLAGRPARQVMGTKATSYIAWHAGAFYILRLQGNARQGPVKDSFRFLD